MAPEPDLLLQPGQLLLELTNAIQAEAEQQARPLAGRSERWQVYRNRLALDAVLAWLQQEEVAAEPVGSQAQLPNAWALVDGTAVAATGARLAIVPTEAMDDSELRVPQERVDLPGWASDYYLGIRLQPDDGVACLWGYATHAGLKTRGTYDARDRSYVLSAEQVAQDLSAFWVARQLCPAEPTRAALGEQPALSLAQAENLIERLSDPEVRVPRLAVPFEQWGALIAHDGWRQRLYERRQGWPEQRSVLQWVQAGVSQLAHQVGWRPLSWQPGPAGARGSERQQALTAFARPLTIAGRSY